MLAGYRRNHTWIGGRTIASLVSYLPTIHARRFLVMSGRDMQGGRNAEVTKG